jgi:hypothetical protein
MVGITVNIRKGDMSKLSYDKDEWLGHRMKTASFIRSNEDETFRPGISVVEKGKSHKEPRLAGVVSVFEEDECVVICNNWNSVWTWSGTGKEFFNTWTLD